MILGKGVNCFIVSFYLCFNDVDKIVFMFKVKHNSKLLRVSFTPKAPHELWLRKELGTNSIALTNFMREVFDVHYNGGDMDITKFPNAFGVCVRVRRFMMKESLADSKYGEDNNAS